MCAVDQTRSIVSRLTKSLPRISSWHWPAFECLYYIRHTSDVGVRLVETLRERVTMDSNQPIWIREHSARQLGQFIKSKLLMMKFHY